MANLNETNVSDGLTVNGELTLNIPLAVVFGGTNASTASGAFANIVSPGGEMTGALTMNNNISVNSKLSDGTIANLIGRNDHNNIWIGSADSAGALTQGSIYLATSANGDAYVSRNDIRHKILDYGVVFQELFSGNIGPSTGAVTVPGISKYHLYLIQLQGQYTPVIALRRGSYIRGIGGYASASNYWTTTFGITISGDTVTYVNCGNFSVNISSKTITSVTNQLAISNIYGLLTTEDDYTV